MNTIKEVLSYSHALRLLTVREVSSRYKGTVIGVLWLFLQPLIMVIVYSFVFSVIMKVRVPGMDNSYHFALYLMAAMMPFMFFQEAILACSQSLFANSALLHKSTLPALLIPLVSVLSTLVSEVIALSIITIAAYLLLEQFSAYLLLLPLLILVRLMLSMALGYVVAILSVFIQDLRQALGLLLTMVLFLTPVFYPAEMIPQQFRWLNEVNPFFHLLDAYRAIIIRGQFPDEGFFILALSCMVFLVFAVLFFNKTINRAKDFV